MIRRSVLTYKSAFRVHIFHISTFKSALFVPMLFSCLTGCVRLPQYTARECVRIYTGPGPEDFVADTSGTRKRLLVSCAQRRKNLPPYGEIWQVDLLTDKASVMPRRNEPAGIPFHPHGMDIEVSGDSVLLYCINHADELKRQLIRCFRIQGDELIFLRDLEHPRVLVSPNDVSVHNGSVFFSNDASRRNSMLEAILGLKTGWVGSYIPSVGWHTSDKRFAYPNGVLVMNDTLWLSTVRQNKIFSRAGVLSEGEWTQRLRLTGGDNIMRDGNSLLVAAHLRQFAFVRHMSDSTKFSPSVIYKIDTETNQKSVLFADDGSNISCASTAWRYRDYLYVSQVFNSWILKVKIRE